MNKNNYYLLDTNSFKIFINSNFNRDDLVGWKLYCTSIQRFEIERYDNIERRNILLDIYKIIAPEMLISPASYYGLGMYGYARYPTPENEMILDGLKQEIMKRDLFNEARGKKKLYGKNPVDRESNWGADAMVLHAALMLGPHCYVVTSDISMKEVCCSHKIKIANPSTLVRKIMIK